MFRTDLGQPIRLADYRPPDYLIDTVDLDISLAAGKTRVRALLSIRPNPAGQPGAPLMLDGDELTPVSLKLNGQALDLALATPQGMTIGAPPSKPFTLEIETRLDPESNTKLMGLYRSGSAWCTQCEAEGFRRITYFLDRPDVLAIYTTRIEADKADAPVLLGNGNPIAAGDVGDRRHFAVWHDPHPKPSYLFAMVAGDLGKITDTFTTRSGKHVDLAIYVEKGKEDRAHYAMDALKRSMVWDERVFGCEYDLDVFNIVAVSDFNMGAMENKGLNVFNDKYVLALPQTATDGDYAGIETVIAHEYFHNWTGNRITCRDWFQLCLKEGLTVFRDQEFSSDERSRPVKRIEDVRGLRAAQFVEDAGPLAHNVRPETYREINNFYTATVYQKGAEVVRMLKLTLGDADFRKGMDLYLSRYDGTAATIEDFLASFAEVSGADLTQFKLWYQQSGTPLVKAVGHYDAGAQTYTLTLSQSVPPTPGQDRKKPMAIPVRLGLVSPTAGDMALDSADATASEMATCIFALTTAQRTIAFRNVPERPVPSLLRGFSAPVNLASDATDADLLALFARDTDSFNRWQAAQTYATRLLLRSAEGIAAGRPAVPDAPFIEAFARLLDEAQAGGPSADHAFLALAAALPSENDLARERGHDVDPGAIFAARRALKVAIGQQLQERLQALYDALGGPHDFSPDAASAGRRSLRNAALDLLACGDKALGERLARAQFDSADNMTDRMAALAVLSHIPGNAREAAFDSFLALFRNDGLVIDKWLSLQAMIPEAGTLARVRKLTDHPAFSMSNPNRVRALAGAFSTGNATQFNRADGQGFAFLAGLVLDLDKANPQLAARLLTAFRSWRNLEPVRRAAAEGALRQVAAGQGLSKDVADIVTRSLA